MNNDLSTIRFESDTNYILRCCNRIIEAVNDNDNAKIQINVKCIVETITIMKTEKNIK